MSAELKIYSLTIEVQRTELEKQRTELQRHAEVIKQLNWKLSDLDALLLTRAEELRIADDELRELKRRETAIFSSNVWLIVRRLDKIKQRAPRSFKILKVLFFYAVKARALLLRTRRSPRVDPSSIPTVSFPSSVTSDADPPPTDGGHTTNKELIQTPDERMESLFDRAWYLAQYPDVASSGLDPIQHYSEIGAAKGYDPNPYFDTDWYQNHHPTINACGLNPLYHYITIGQIIGLRPNLLFDSEWYSSTYPDVATSGMNPLQHYLRVGALESRSPGPLFDARWYLKANSDLSTSEGSALKHFLHNGASEGRACHSLFSSVHSKEAYTKDKPYLEALASLTNDIS